MADCDVEQALQGVLGAIYENAGQICSAGSRLVIARPLHERFVQTLAQRARTLKTGHALTDPGLGPVNSAAQLARIDGHVQRARARGAQVVTGGRPTTDLASGNGWFFEPTILDGLAPDDPAVQQEIFGPVLCVQVFDEPEEALALANGTDYALVAGVYTRDFAAAHRLARELDAGQVYINEYFAGGIEVPFGGNRHSGFGREKGLEGLRNYCRVKSVAARLT
jgi:aldehyde dehydrogenase (NAD+)/betaine-aldehyde dehydrogenase